MHYKRILGIDYGDVRVGLAQTDLLQMIASPLETIKNAGEEALLSYIANLAKSNDVEKIVVGLPLNIDGSVGERAEITYRFGEKLKQATGLEIIFQDERLSSFEAEELLKEAKVNSKKQKSLIDKLSACIILEDYLNERG